MDFKYAIFDMDGTLIDSMHLWRNIEISLMEKYTGQIFNKEIKEMLKIMPLREMVGYINENFGTCVDVKDAGSDSDSIMCQNYISGNINVKPYVFEYLDYLKTKNIKIALATATPKNLCVPFLEKVGLIKYFDVIATTKDDVGIGKSKGPDVYDFALKKIGGNKNNTIIFEDVLVAIKTAKVAGYYVIAVPDQMQGSTRSEIISLADRFIDSFKEMMV